MLKKDVSLHVGLLRVAPHHFWRPPALAPDLILFILGYLALPDHFYSLIKYVHEKLAAGEAVLLMD